MKLASELFAVAALSFSWVAVADTPASLPTSAPVSVASAPLDEDFAGRPAPPLLEVAEVSVPAAPREASLGLRSDTMLHPGDSFTAYTLKRGELVYNQSVATLPLPSWAWWGVTDRLTVELDLLPLLGGLLVEPHLPVPSVNARYKLRDHVGKGPAFAVEAMFQHQWVPFDGQLNEESTVRIVRAGSSFFARVNMSQILSKALRLHASLGASWAQDITIESQNIPVARGREFHNLISPDASLSLDWRFSTRVSLHLTGSYGNTFVYLDNVPRKVELAYALRVAPFYKSKLGFFRVMRVEGAAFWLYFQDAKEWLALPIPVFPYLYWQW